MYMVCVVVVYKYMNMVSMDGVYIHMVYMVDVVCMVYMYMFVAMVLL